MQRIYPVPYKTSDGFTLLEVLIALGIVSITMVVVAESLFHVLFAEERAGSMIEASLQIQSVSSQHAAGVYTNSFGSYLEPSRLATGRESDEKWQVYEITKDTPSAYVARLAVPPEKSDMTLSARNNPSSSSFR